VRAVTDSGGDEVLFERWAAGDTASGEQLFARHFDAIYRFFRNKVDSDSEELTQRTFLRCVEAQAGFRRMSSFRTFLFGIARNILREHFRERRRDDRLDFRSVSAADLGISAGTQIAASEEQRVLLAALRTIPVEMQELVELYYWEDLSIAQLAELLGAPPGTIKRWLWRARQRLARALEDMDLSEALQRTTLSSLESWAESLRTSKS
jgi:RNA polymerase sigma-70 factor (ECF subfamily)